MGKLKTTPPRWIDSVLRWYCSSDRLEEIQGDLHELYEEDRASVSNTKANFYYLWNVMRCAKPYAFKSKSKPKFHNNTIAMFLKNLKITVRQLVKNASYTFINLSGLTLGILCFSFIYLYVDHELSYDKFHKNREALYTVPFTWHFGATSLPTASATSSVGLDLYQEYPEVQNFLRFKSNTHVISTDQLSAEESGVLYADSSLFSLLNFELVHGDPKLALVEPQSIILTEPMAEKYFGVQWKNKSLLGRSLLLDNKEEFIVSGIVKAPPTNSHIQFDFLASFSSLPEAYTSDNYQNSAYMTYVQLAPGTNSRELTKKVSDDIRKAFKGELPIEIGLRPFDDIYLKSGMGTVVGPISDIKMVYIFSGIGLLIILIACINYMNLATARSVERAKEVGVRKVLGAQRGELITQFLGESFLMTGLSILLAILLMHFFLPAFNNIAQKSLSPHLMTNPELQLFFLGIWFSISLLAGLYPAFALSGFSVVGVLKGKFKNSNAGLLLRKTLVVFQFSISVILITATIVIYRQLDFVQTADLGYDQERIISLPLDPQSRPHIDFLKTEFEKLAEVQATSVTGQLPSRITFESTMAIKEGEENRHLMRLSYIDNDYLETLGLTVLAGGQMSESNVDEYEFVINESAASFFGWTHESALGQKIKIWNSEYGKVVGVVKDFHFSSLHEKIRPLILYNTEDAQSFGLNHLMIKTDSKNLTATLTEIENIWKEVIDHKPFNYTFLADKLEASYVKETRLSKLISIFSVLAIVIGCLGLFGLISYTVHQKSKEIGIRKVLGASGVNIITILSKAFSSQILISLIIGLSAAYWLLSLWLSNFEYKTSISWDVMAIAASVTIGISFITMSYKSIQATLINPVSILKED